jgi:hypothetical protein
MYIRIRIHPQMRSRFYHHTTSHFEFPAIRALTPYLTLHHTRYSPKYFRTKAPGAFRGRQGVGTGEISSWGMGVQLLDIQHPVLRGTQPRDSEERA